MKVIDLFDKIANDEEVPKKIKFRDLILEWDYEFQDYKFIKTGNHFLYNGIATEVLKVKIEIIEEETTYEQNFTGWQIIQNGKVVASYNHNAPTLKKVDVVDVKKDIKEMLGEKPKKIEEITIRENGTIGFPDGEWTARNMDKAFAIKINKLTKAVNYLLEKESDK